MQKREKVFPNLLHKWKTICIVLVFSYLLYNLMFYDVKLKKNNNSKQQKVQFCKVLRLYSRMVTMKLDFYNKIP